jgi:hypothetical protein
MTTSATLPEAPPEGPQTSRRAMEVLAVLADALRTGAHEVRSFALMPLGDAALRADIVRNARLEDRINSRLFNEEGWILPDHLDDFPQADVLIALLRHGPSQVLRGLGFAWHGNRIAHMLLSGGRELGARLGRDDLRRVLALRDLGLADTAGPVPADVEIDRDGELCLWCWMAALPKRIHALGLAVLLKDCCAHAEYAGLSDPDRKRRATLADAWLQMTLPDLQAA